MRLIFTSWHLQQMIAAMICYFLVTISYRKQIGNINFLAWTYIGWSSLFLAFYPDYDPNFLHNLLTEDKIIQFIPEIAKRTQWTAAQSALLSLLLPLLVLKLPKKYIQIFLLTFIAFESLSMLIFEETAFLGTTFSAALSAMAFLIVPNKLSNKIAYPLMILYFINVYVYGGSTAWAILGLTLIYFLYLLVQRSRYFLLLTLPALYIGYQRLNIFFDGNGRYEMWKVLLNAWHEHIPIWTGTGIGSWEWIGIFLYRQPNDGVHYLWPHNDFLQMLFEGGIIGLSLMIAVIIQAMYRLRFKTKLIAAFGYVLFMYSYYPAHWAVTQILGLYLLNESIKEKAYSE